MTKLSDLSKEQMLMYAGAAGTAACALTAVGSSTVMEKHIYTKTAPAVPGGMGKRLMNWHVVESLSLSALQAVSAQEKPSKKMLGATGAAWLGAAAVMGTHTFHHKSTDQNIGTALTVGSVAIGGAMIARAIQMHRNE